MQSLRSYAEDIWVAQGPIVRAYGISFDTRMTVVKLSSGALWINSPVESSPHEMQSLEQIGPVRHLVSPTPLHDWRLEEWSRAFPNAICRRARDLSDDVPQEWVEDLDQVVFRGSRALDEVEFFHRKSRTLIFGDFIQNHQPRNPLVRAIAKAAGASGGVPIDIRWSFSGKKALGRASLERLLSWDFEKMILSHGTCVDTNAKDFVRRAFRWLDRPNVVRSSPP